MERINREMLERAFDTIRYREGRGGKQFAYVEAHEVAKRLNDAFDGQYSFEVYHWQESASEIIVHGALSVTLDDGTVVKKHNVGSAEVKTNKNTGEIEAYGDTVKSAVSDCLKRCAAFGFGVGLHLYFGDEAPTPQTTGSAPAATRTSNSTDVLSQAQKNAIFAIGKAKNLGAKALDDIASRDFGGPVERLNKAQASRFIQYLQAFEQREAG
jgi:recombination DNA repair RAD52 pathway protein